MGRTKYAVGRIIIGTDRMLDNGIHELYINAAHDDGTEIAELMEFFTETGIRKQQFPDLSDRIQYLKEEKEGVTRMCEAVRKYGDERQSLGMQNKQRQVVESALKMKMPLETIAQLVGLSVEEVQKLVDEIKSAEKLTD